LGHDCHWIPLDVRDDFPAAPHCKRFATSGASRHRELSVPGQPELEGLVGREVHEPERVGRDLQQCPRRRKADELAVVNVGSSFVR